MSTILEAWKSIDPSAKRKIFVVSGVVICFFAYKAVTQGGREEIQQERTSAHYVQAGAVLCNDQYQASSQARIGKGVFKNQINPGCQEVGANVEVNILEQTSFNGIDVVKVGNRGGVAWAAADDVR